MWNWLTDNPTALVLSLGFVALLCYTLWLRSTMNRSKAQFALAVIGTQVSFAITGLKFLSGSGSFVSTLRRHGLDVIPALDWIILPLGVVTISITLTLIYLLASRTIKH